MSTIEGSFQGTISGGGSGGVTAVTGVAPIASSGGTTPAISVATATDAALGVVQPDGTIITVSSGEITVPKASNSTFGVVEVDGTTITASGGVISAVGGGGSGALTKIAQVVANGSSGVVEFSAIPGTYSSLWLVAYGAVSDSGVTVESITLEFNSDAGGNYRGQDIVGAGTSVSAVGNGSTNPLTIFGFPAGSAGTNTCGGGSFLVPNYANTSFYKIAVANSGYIPDNTLGDFAIFPKIIQWLNVNAITDIKLTDAGGGNFVAGSTFTLYGLS